MKPRESQPNGDPPSVRQRLIERLAGTSETPPRPLTKRAPAARTLSSLRPAAVLVPVIDHAEGVTLLFTRRADHLRNHAGQICFPGGRREPGDADASDTALREAGEEIGLARDRVSLIGYLDDYPTSTHFLVTPVVGLVPPGERFRIDRREVSATFEVPLNVMLDESRYRRGIVHRHGLAIPYYSIEYEGRLIWGATAGMLRNLADKLR